MKFRAIAAATEFQTAMGHLRRAPRSTLPGGRVVDAVCSTVDRVVVVDGPPPQPHHRYVVGYRLDDDDPRPTSRRYA